MKRSLFIFFVLIASALSLHGYTFTFKNNYKKPVRFFVEYGSFVCGNDDISLKPGEYRTVHTELCCWHTFAIECDGRKTKDIKVIDAYKSVAQALTLPSCREQHFWVNEDGYYGITQSDKTKVVIDKLPGA